MGQHFLRFAAEQQRRHAAAAMRCHDDRVAFGFLCGGKDRFPRCVRDRMQRVAFDAAGFCLQLDRGQDFFRFLRRQRLVLFFRDGLIDDAVGVRGHRIIRRRVERRQFRLERLRQCDRVGNRFARQA